MKHKWNSNPKTRAKESSSVQCVRCGMIRQYVCGIATYFLNDNVYDRYAPKCAGTWQRNDSMEAESRDISGGVYGRV